VRDLLPDFCSLPMTLGLVLYGELFAIVLALASPSRLAEFWVRLGPLSLFVLVIALLSATLLCLLRRLLRLLDGRIAVAVALALVVGSALGVGYATLWLLPWAESGGLLPDDGTRGLLIRAGLISAIVGAMMLRYLYLHGQWRAQVEAVANARFQTLQARIRPHFLFNSMNTIASLTQTDPRLAEEVTLDLADLFRASLATDAVSTTLDAELELIRRYLHIESQRLGERMQVAWDLADLPGDAMVPPLILQPLVENAVYHGIQPSTEPGRIVIVGRYRRGIVNLSVRNTLPEPSTGRRSSPVWATGWRLRMWLSAWRPCFPEVPASHSRWSTVTIWYDWPFPIPGGSDENPGGRRRSPGP
jgi:two-component system sensor histidine kinase AlgZ